MFSVSVSSVTNVNKASTAVLALIFAVTSHITSPSVILCKMIALNWVIAKLQLLEFQEHKNPSERTLLLLLKT